MREGDFSSVMHSSYEFRSTIPTCTPSGYTRQAG